MDNWLYYKIYPKQPELLNEIILDIVKPTIKFFFSDIKSWFFIRYADENGFHIRLRLYVSQVNNNKINDWFRAIEAKELRELKIKTTKKYAWKKSKIYLIINSKI
ncbi:lantibiotic dehydratase C-terminal domain-containing protein [Bacillus sp. JCM 19041]|uniref:lantibiotic dehydratase C-terminal domain-containing protein n=1 Tax=Bacillus sp. JCM 19041 TaxID=1460637 RepID=UPI0006D034C2